MSSLEQAYEVTTHWCEAERTFHETNYITRQCWDDLQSECGPLATCAGNDIFWMELTVHSDCSGVDDLPDEGEWVWMAITSGIQSVFSSQVDIHCGCFEETNGSFVCTKITDEAFCGPEEAPSGCPCDD